MWKQFEYQIELNNENLRQFLMCDGLSLNRFTLTKPCIMLDNLHKLQIILEFHLYQSAEALLCTDEQSNQVEKKLHQSCNVWETDNEAAEEMEARKKEKELAARHFVHSFVSSDSARWFNSIFIFSRNGYFIVQIGCWPVSLVSHSFVFLHLAVPTFQHGRSRSFAFR